MKKITYLGFICIIIFLFSIRAYSQTESISIKLGGTLLNEKEMGVVPSSTWNTVIKGNSTNLLDNTTSVSTCFIRSNATETLSNPVEGEPLLSNSFVIDNQGFITFLQVPYTRYDVYVYLNTEKNEETIAKITLNNQSKFVKMGNGAWKGKMAESKAITGEGAVIGENYLVFTGVTDESFTLWTESSIATGPSAIQIVKSTSATTGTSELLPDKPASVAKPFLYPNPVKDDMFVELNNEYAGKVTIKIIDMQGKELQSVASTKQDGTWVGKINTGQLKSGNYMMIVEYNNTKSSVPFIKY
jgi:hypothetical protein